MTQPKEIYINNQDADAINHFGMVQDAVIWSDKLDGIYIKYLSEEYFKSLIEEKDKEIEHLKAKIKVLENLNPNRSRRISNEFIEPIKYNSTEPTCVICGQFKNMCICRTPTF